MAVPAVPYLITTRVIAGFVAIIPLYVIGLLTSYGGSRMVTVFVYGQSAGTYDHYFGLFLPPIDILLSFVKVLMLLGDIIMVHCRMGFRPPAVRPGRRGRGPRGPPQPGHRRGAGPDPVDGAVGRLHHGEDRRMSAAKTARPADRRGRHRPGGRAADRRLPGLQPHAGPAPGHHAAHRRGGQRPEGRLRREVPGRPGRAGRQDQRHRRGRRPEAGAGPATSCRCCPTTSWPGCCPRPCSGSGTSPSCSRPSSAAPSCRRAT